MWIVLLTIGVFIGWNLPQPEFAKKAQDWVINKIGPDINF
jgi:hypothetical protein